MSVQKSLTLLHGILERACEAQLLQANPARYVRKPSARREREVRPLAPRSVEQLRAELLERDRFRDATLVSVLAYAGLRPHEATWLRWEHVRKRTLLVEPRNKTRSGRPVDLIGPVGQDLAEWRMLDGRPGDRQLVFPRAIAGDWTKDDRDNWRDRVYHPAARAAGVEGTTPYTLRHSFVSLLLREGRSIVEVAAQAGHSVKVCSETYAHVIAELDPEDRAPAEAQIRRARGELVPSSYLQARLDLGS